MINGKRVTSFMANSSVSSFVNNMNTQKQKKPEIKKDKFQYGNSLAVNTYQIDNNFMNLKVNLKLLDSTFDIWNFHPKSSINVIFL